MRKRVSVISIKAVRESSVLYEKRRIEHAGDAIQFASPFFCDADRELIYVCSVSTKKEPLTMELVAMGTLDTCSASPREIFKGAILSNASGIFCFHNHPSGDCKPSLDDNILTRRLVEAGELLGIELIDHIILGEQSKFYSYGMEGKLCTKL
ncbi:MAG: JAB domain-containing protein [Eubacteriales bacterium]